MVHSAATTPTKRRPFRLWSARLGWALVLLFVAGVLLANLPHSVEETRRSWSVGEAWPFARHLFRTQLAFARWIVAGRLLSGAVFFGTALWLAWRKGRDATVLLFSADLLLLGLFFTLNFDVATLRFPTLISRWLPNPAGVSMLLVVGAMLTLVYLFPDGAIQPRRLRWLQGTAAANAVAWTALFGFSGLARAVEAHIPVLRDADENGWYWFVGSLAAALAVGLVGQIGRYVWVSSAEQRQQTKWALIGLFALLATPFGAFVLMALLGVDDQPVGYFVQLHLDFIIAVLPLTIAGSMLRYRLWDVDPILSRTLVYGSLSAIVITLYVLVVGGLGQLLRGDNDWLPVITTGVVALAFNPLREWLQRRVNRLLYGEQDDPVQLLAQLGARLEATADAAALLPTLVQTTATALKLPYVAVQLDGAEPAAAYGAPGGWLETWPLLYQGAGIGRLQVARRAPSEPFTPREQRLLATIAQQAGAAAHAARLSADLRQSRQRIVIAREEERRRLRRDLHDGLGPQLATLALQIDAARNVLASDPHSAESLLRDLKMGAQNAIAEIRRVVHDLRPPALDQLGLAEAIRQHAAAVQHNGLTVSVETPDALPPLPAAVEVAAYRMAVEALTNVARHAHATRATVHLHLADGALRLEIRDNGVGLPADYRPGVGVTSMRERSAELGGALDLRSANGVHVMAAFPLEPAL